MLTMADLDRLYRGAHLRKRDGKWEVRFPGLPLEPAHRYELLSEAISYAKDIWDNRTLKF